MELEWPREFKKGMKIEAGDVINFSYGIPPVGVNAPVFDRDGKLMVNTNGHNPPELSLSQFKKTIPLFYVRKKQ